MAKKNADPRISEIKRQTAETLINAKLNLDGNGEYKIDTGIGFFDHMLEGFARHGYFDLNLSCEGDLLVDGHHSVEDCGIVLGNAIKDALDDKEGICRYGHCILPMDDALVLCAIDLCGRPYFEYDAAFPTERIGYLDTELIREFFYAVSYSAAMNLHIRVLSGLNSHHICEAMFKSFAKSLDMATGFDPRLSSVLSTKGSL
ncbi:MAG: imidazoleglycerol-phosphate dehydratase HisB [Lachnospiraceae bacterium]|nr:imidazoleglycerol-phosphate dehydratase HisB [Lachnospiraceae bacterium]